MTSPRTALAVTAAKAASLATRLSRRGGGTALPGLVAERIDPAVVAHLGRQLGRGLVLVTGTNGKTTTSRVIASALRESRIPTIHNREGSNLMRGIASALLGAAGPSGAIRAGSRRAGLFEVDEATTPAAARALAPRVMTVTNLFRDQLDRYGEVDTVFALWREAVAALPPGATLVLNADDPSVAELALDHAGPVHWFGIDLTASGIPALPPGASDARWCRVCGGSFAYTERYFAHIGLWRCEGCGRARPTPDTLATQIRFDLTHATFSVPGLGDVTTPLTGLYNVYNAAAAIATARVIGLEPPAITAALANVRAAFGRQESVDLQRRTLRLFLTKNPAGANQVLRFLAALDRPLKLAFLLNDGTADGHDVSWIWDVDFELLAPSVHTSFAAGDRAEDIALRLKYAGWPPAATVARTPAALLDTILARTSPGDDIFLLPTYTAMLSLREELVRRGAASPFWSAE